MTYRTNLHLEQQVESSIERPRLHHDDHTSLLIQYTLRMMSSVVSCGWKTYFSTNSDGRKGFIHISQMTPNHQCNDLFFHCKIPVCAYVWLGSLTRKPAWNMERDDVQHTARAEARTWLRKAESEDGTRRDDHAQNKHNSASCFLLPMQRPCIQTTRIQLLGSNALV